MSARHTAIHALKQRRRVAEKRAGVTHSVPVATVLPHVRALLAAGWTPTRIARAAGVSAHSVLRIVRGDSTRPHAATARAILAVTPAGAMAAAGTDPQAARVPSTGTHRRIRALMALGWPHRELTARIGHNTSDILRGSLVSRDIAAAVADVYDDLWDKPGPSTITRARAKGLGYPPPMAWDDDRIDDPAARPLGIGLKWKQAA